MWAMQMQNPHATRRETLQRFRLNVWADIIGLDSMQVILWTSCKKIVQTE